MKETVIINRVCKCCHEEFEIAMYEDDFVKAANGHVHLRDVLLREKCSWCRNECGDGPHKPEIEQ